MHSKGDKEESAYFSIDIFRRILPMLLIFFFAPKDLQLILDLFL